MYSSKNNLNMSMMYLFINIISKGAKSNTYKFALAKFLLDYSKNKEVDSRNEYTVNYSEIAEKFLEYYWFQECKYKFKQDFNKNKMPIVIRIIQKYCGVEYISDSYETYFKTRQDIKVNLIEEIEKKCFKDVVPRFQPREKNLFYQHFSQAKVGHDYSPPTQKSILLKKEAVIFFKEEYESLSKILVLEWAKFLEKTNFTPRLISKIELMRDPKRSSLTKFRKVLLGMVNQCFYCGVSFDKSDVHIDHFIPWSYIYEDEIWNLVPACSKCNLFKSDALPPRECIEKIIVRNKKNQLTEWNSNIHDYYENCYKAGFNIVDKEKLQCFF